MHFAGLVGEAALQRDNLGYHEFHHAAGVGKGGVEHGYTVSTGRRQVYLVGPDAKGANSEQMRGGFKGAGGDLGIAPHAEHVDLGETRQQLIFG
jgi:hypothetical protein